MIADHLLVLLVVLPLIAAPICVVLGSGRGAWLLTLVVCWVLAAMSATLAYQVLAGGEAISYAIGGWAAPWGIEYRVDPANAYMLLIVTWISAVLVPYAYRSVRLEIPEDRQHLFYCLYLLCQTGMMGIAITGDAFNVFVFLEISSLSSYALIALGWNRRALTAAFSYLVMGTIGATFILIGIGLLYAMTGTLNMADLHERLQNVSSVRPVLAAFAFITVGTMLKFALFPLHKWLPNAYAYAPSVVSAFIAATSTKIAIYVLLRFAFSVFGVRFSFLDLPLEVVLAVPALLAMFSGSIVAIFQSDIKRMLAYSSIAQIGYIALGISLVTVTGLTAGIVHIFNHALMKAALFAALGCIFYRLTSVRLADMAGLAKEMPLTAACFTIAGFSLIGTPLTAGFVSKWILVEAALESGIWWLAVLILASSLLAIVYIWRVVEVMYFRPRPENRAAVSEAPLSMLVPTAVLALANIYFGLETSLSAGMARQAATALLKGVW